MKKITWGDGNIEKKTWEGIVTKGQRANVQDYLVNYNA